MRSSKEILKICLPFFIIIVIGLISYSNSFHCSFQFDDIPGILANPFIRDITDLGAIGKKNTIPTRYITYLTFAINYHLHKINVFGYHVANFLIHIVSACLVYLIVVTILSMPKFKETRLRRFRDTIALFTSLVFVTHPLQTQAVTYIYQRLASLATMCYLLSLFLFLKGRLNQIHGLKGRVYFIFSSLIAFIGIFTKEIVFTLPLILIISEILFCGDKAHGFKMNFHLREKSKPSILYILAISIFSMLIPILFISKSIKVLRAATKSHSHVGEIVTSGKYFITQFSIILKYIQLLFVPINQTFDYDYALSKGFFELTTFISFIALLAILIMAFWLIRKNSLLSFGIFWLFITLSVESSIIPIRNIIWEHRLYLPMFGFALFLNVLIFRLTKNIKKFTVIMSIIIAIFSYLTFQRNKVYATQITFWKDSVIKSPNKARPNCNLAGAYIDEKQYDKALPYLVKSISIDPSYVKSYYNFSSVYSAKGDYKGALKYALKAFNMNPADPMNSHNLGYLYAKIGNYKQALKYYRKLISLAPTVYNLSEYYKMVLIYYRETKDKAGSLKYAEVFLDYGLDELYRDIEKVTSK